MVSFVPSAAMRVASDAMLSIEVRAGNTPLAGVGVPGEADIGETLRLPKMVGGGILDWDSVSMTWLVLSIGDGLHSGVLNVDGDGNRVRGRRIAKAVATLWRLVSSLLWVALRCKRNRRVGSSSAMGHGLSGSFCCSLALFLFWPF